MAAENAAVLKLVARLVMDYLDEQNLSDAYNTFCETSRHLSDQEYTAYSQGIRSLDNTGIGLINIVHEYFLIKDKLKDFIKTCPKTSTIINLIDTTNLQSRLDIVFKVLKDNLLKFDKVQEEVSRKRRKTENDLFEISQTNTSTPESVQPSKKRRISCSKTTNLVNNSNIEKKTGDVVLGNKQNNFLCSPETSNKEDDVTDDESGIKKSSSNPKIAPPPELLSETFLKKPDFAENLADLINKTLAEREDHENSEKAESSQNKLTNHDVQDILLKTENDFEDILKEVIDKYLIDGSEGGKTANDSLMSTHSKENEVKGEEIPIKQRLRPRTAKKIPPAERKKKINVISNELYNGPLPLCVQMAGTSTSTHINPPTFVNSIENQPLILVPIMQPSTSKFIPLQSFHPAGNIICETNKSITSTELPSNVQVVFNENITPLPISDQNIVNIIDNNNFDEGDKNVEKVQKTPKMTIQTNFLESKCKSTPRRKATHVRILDFNQTPSGRLAAIKECKTPSNSIRVDTPGSAPASIMTSQKVKTERNTIEVSQNVENGNKFIDIVDESSNSNSISNTPKVVKNRRRRKIEIDSKIDKEEPSPKPITREDWMKMREEQKNLSVDERMRILFQQTEEKNNLKKRKTPKKKKEDVMRVNSLKNKNSMPLSTNVQQAKGKLCAKFKVTSPRKSALLRKNPKKKKVSIAPSLDLKPTTNIDIKDSKETQQEIPKNETMEPKKDLNLSVLTLNSNNVSLDEEKKDEGNYSNDLNRSDTIQEVANLLTNLPETILAKTNKGNRFDQSQQKSDMVDAAILMETPLKVESISPLPNTPRFAVPLMSTHHETPLSKEIITVTTAPSVLKVCDILTPSFPITPGFKITPAKSEASPSGYSSRRTDYSSCSSYYKPDESEEINQNFDNIIKQSKVSSQSELDGGYPNTVLESKEKVRIGSTKKVECPGAFDRVLSFTEESNAVIVPHYNMNEEGLLSESMLTTGSDDSSSTFTCSTCSTDPSSDENTMQKLCKADINDDRDSEWKCEEEIDITSNTSLVDEKTGEVRFPLRNWITPKKIDPQETTKLIIDEVITEKVLIPICTENAKSIEEQKEEERKQRIANLEAIKLRTIKIIQKETASNAKKIQPKYKKSNIKQFKVPAEQQRQFPLTRREQILQQHLTERPRSTPLKLISSTSISSSSSSRRKCLTPRKTIIMDELPKADPVARKPNKKRLSSDKAKSDGAKIIKSPVKPEKVSLENISDNASMHDDHPSLNTSFHDTSNEEPENTVVNKNSVKFNEEGSNTFQRTLIAQGFDKVEAKDLQIKLVDKIETEQQQLDTSKIPEPQEDQISKDEGVEEKKMLNMNVPESESENEEIEDECEFNFADSLEKNVFVFEEPPDFVARKEMPKIDKLCAPAKLQIDGKTVKIDFTETMDIFTMEPIQKQNDDKNQKKEPLKDVSKTSEQKILTKEISIDKILAMIHGQH